MTKKSATKRSTKTSRSSGTTSTRSKRSSTSKGQKTLSNRVVTIAAVVIVVVLGAYYMLTGSDPLGLFSQVEGTPVAEIAPLATNTAFPAVQKAPPSTTAPPLSTAGSGGDWWQVYFTDPQTINDPDDLTGSIPEKLIEYIDGAQRTIHIAAFEFNLTPVAEALIAAHKRGVQVRWVTDDEYGLEEDDEEEHGQFAMLEKARIKVKSDDRAALMHNKFWIFDQRTVWTGSTNITVNGNFRNNNNVLIIDSPQVAAIYEREFAEMWDGEFGPTSPSTADRQAVTIDGTPVQILFAAEDEVISRLIPLIEGARSSIRFMAFSFTHDELGDAVLARAKAGVDVKGIFETRGSETEYSELTLLHCAKVPVRQDGNPHTFHHKVFVIDDQTVVTGSLNFSHNADESNDENVVIVTHRDIAAQYLGEFERRWAEATPPEAGDIQCK